jgi:hypothetical protein
MKKLTDLFTLGDLYVSDFIKDEHDYNERNKYELKLTLEEDTGAARLESMPPKHMMWGKYWYRSGTNETMKNHLSDVVSSVVSLMQLKENDIWLDIACNDGTLLSYVPKYMKKIGIDPADDSFIKESKNHADDVIQDYFSKNAYNKSKFSNNKAKVVTTIAMFYDIEDPDFFMKEVYDIMHDDGVWVLQMSYTPLMIEQMAFDNICHEHLYYYSLFNIKKILERNNFKILNCSLNDANGGSFRIYCIKDKAEIKKYSTQQNRDIFKFNVESILAYEKSLLLDKKETWIEFFNKIEKLKKETKEFIVQEKKAGKIIAGYGASTKGNTLLQYFGIDHTLIDYMVERSPYKFGLKTVGTNIPIISENEMRTLKPDYLLILPWHFIDEFVQREQEYLNSGGKFIVPCPKFEVISK